MNEISFPTQSTKTLIKATVAAVLLAVVLFITVVLPAEYNIDITGVGEKLGLTVLSAESDNETPNGQASFTEEQLAADGEYPYREDEVAIVIPAKKGLEYKFQLEQYGKLTYEWKTNDNARLYLDFHGEPEGDTTGFFEVYTSATTYQMKGAMTVPFNGVHGWYWRNTTNEDITVTLKTYGNYQVIGKI